MRFGWKSVDGPKSTKPGQIGAKGEAHVKQLGPNTAKLDSRGVVHTVLGQYNEAPCPRGQVSG